MSLLLTEISVQCVDILQKVEGNVSWNISEPPGGTSTKNYWELNYKNPQFKVSFMDNRPTLQFTTL